MSSGGGRSGQEQVALLNQVIRVSLWKSWNWTEQSDSKKYLREECLSCRKALNLDHIWHVWRTTRRTMGWDRVGEEHSWWYFRNVFTDPYGSMIGIWLSLWMKWTSLGEFWAEQFYYLTFSNGNRQCEDLSTGATCGKTKPMNSSPKWMVETQPKVK